mgnify:CR=1 FL=1
MQNQARACACSVSHVSLRVSQRALPETILANLAICYCGTLCTLANHDSPVVPLRQKLRLRCSQVFEDWYNKDSLCSSVRACVAEACAKDLAHDAATVWTNFYLFLGTPVIGQHAQLLGSRQLLFEPTIRQSQSCETTMVTRRAQGGNTSTGKRILATAAASNLPTLVI